MLADGLPDAPLPDVVHLAAADASPVPAASAATSDALTDAEREGYLSLRDVVLRAYPDVVAELVQGQTLADLLESVPTAQAAWQRAVYAAAMHARSAAGTATHGQPADTAHAGVAVGDDATLLASMTPSLPPLAPLPGAAGGSVVRSAQPGLEQMTPLARIRAGLRA